MDSEEEDFEFNLNSLDSSETDQNVIFGDRKANSTTSPTLSSSSDQEDTLSSFVSRPPLLLRTMDIPSVRHPPVSVMAPADRVSAHDLTLAESFSAIGGEREKYHNNNNNVRLAYLI